MPVYDYKCKACGYADEYVKSFSDDEVPDCDNCDTPMTQLVSLWAKTPGNHGGNPYCHDFMTLIEQVITKIAGGELNDLT